MFEPEHPLISIPSVLHGSLTQYPPGDRETRKLDDRTVAGVSFREIDVTILISWGHPAPLLLRRTAATALTVPEPAPPAGLGWMSGNPYVPATFPFTQGDRLLLYTDGVTETRDRDGAFYPLAKRITAWTGQAETVDGGIAENHIRLSYGMAGRVTKAG